MTDTKWNTAADKEKFLKSLQRFVKSGFKRSLFTNKMYNRLHMMFGHIAHYDADGFRSEWFEDNPEKWLCYVRNAPTYGDPQWTWCDVERAFKEWLERDYYGI